MSYITKRRISVKRGDDKQDKKRHNDKWNKYYQNPRWKKLRSWYMSLRPLCVDCLFEGRSVPAEELHHVIPFSRGKTEEERMELLLDPDNLAALCKKHHDARHYKLNHSL